MTDKTRRRDLMRPVQLLGIAFAAAVFTGLVTAMVMGAFQAHPVEQTVNAWVVAGIAAGVAFIAVLLVLSLLLLVVDPADVEKPVDRPVLVDPSPSDPGDGGDDNENTSSSDQER